MMKSNIEKVRDYGENFGEKIVKKFFTNIKTPPWNWGDALKKYKYLHTLYKSDFKDNKKEEVDYKVLKLRNLYGLQLCIHNDELPRVAQHLFERKKDISKYIKCGDKNIVEDIAKKAASPKRLWTFATKFCFFVDKDDRYPIDDSLVRGALKHYKEELRKTANKHYGPFAKQLKDVEKIWRNPDPNTSGHLDYSVYKDAIDYFIKIYHLDGITYRKLDWYLWVFGKILKKKKEALKKKDEISKSPSSEEELNKILYKIKVLKEALEEMTLKVRKPK